MLPTTLAAFKFRCLQLLLLFTTAVLWHWAGARPGQRVCTPYPVWRSPLPSEDQDGEEDVSPASSKPLFSVYLVLLCSVATWVPHTQPLYRDGVLSPQNVTCWGFRAVLGTTLLEQPHSSAAAPPDPVQGVQCEMDYIDTCGGLEGCDCTSL